MRFSVLGFGRMSARVWQTKLFGLLFGSLLAILMQCCRNEVDAKNTFDLSQVLWVWGLSLDHGCKIRIMMKMSDLGLFTGEACRRRGKIEHGYSVQPQGCLNLQSQMWMVRMF